jgi:hypothetical protein
MTRKSSKAAEIEALAAELGKKAGRAPEPEPAPAAAAAAAGGDQPSDAEAVLAQLKAAHEDGLEETRDFTGNHPIAALSAAFLLGIAVGRLWRSA